jgi:malonate-semialdehyde dehydrogenase (acetylating)/methylmalonate-semialdehyde dehydrogenase
VGSRVRRADNSRPQSATGDTLAAAPLSSADDVAKAVKAASKALQHGAAPGGDRIQPLFRLKALLDANFTEIAKLVTQECGKTLAESEGELKRGIENVEVAAASRRS